MDTEAGVRHPEESTGVVVPWLKGKRTVTCCSGPFSFLNGSLRYLLVPPRTCNERLCGFGLQVTNRKKRVAEC